MIVYSALIMDLEAKYCYLQNLIIDYKPIHDLAQITQ
jgi:hypothetical protein